VLTARGEAENVGGKRDARKVLGTMNPQWKSENATRGPQTPKGKNEETKGLKGKADWKRKKL